MKRFKFRNDCQLLGKMVEIIVLMLGIFANEQIHRLHKIFFSTICGTKIVEVDLLRSIGRQYFHFANSTSFGNIMFIKNNGLKSKTQL